MEHIPLEDERWAWKGAGVREDESKVDIDDIVCPSFTVQQLRDAQPIRYWGALGDSLLCWVDGRQYIVCSTAVRQRDEYLAQRIRGMMAHALASFATDKYQYIWTSELGWLQTMSAHGQPPIVLRDVILGSQDDELIAEPKIMPDETSIAAKPFVLVRHVLLLQSHLRPLDLVLRDHLPGCGDLGSSTEDGGSESDHISHTECLCGLSLCAGVVASLEELHMHGLMHNDIRTSAFIARHDGSILLGAMWSCSVPGGTWWNREISDDWLLWRSPEARTGLLCDSHADVFSLALVMLHILGVYAGVIEPSEQEAIPTLVAEASLCCSVPHNLAVHIPPELLDILNQMLAEESFDRPDCFEVLAVLDEFFTADTTMHATK